MYAGRIFAKAFAETRKFWTIHRNWTVAAGPLGAIVVRGLRDGWTITRTDLGGTFIAAAIGFAISWMGTLVINLARAPALLDRERENEIAAGKRQIKELNAALEREQYNLSQSPQLIVGFNQEFFIRNIGNVDGRDAKIHSMRLNEFLLYSDQVAYIGAGDTVFNLRCRQDGNGGSPVLNQLQSGDQAFRMFIQEIIRTTPLPEAIQKEENVARRGTREYQHLMMNTHMLILDLMYSDFAGHQYLSPATVVWTLKDGGRIVEVRPQPIRKLTSEQAKELGAGEYLRTVAGVDTPAHNPGEIASQGQLSSERRLPL